ncbi:MAG: hypothetical protein J5I93_26605 [Pirellulaceae bacterium]|nr:hypothetical protein [Pirellulaceae bacterium]
MSYEFRIAVGLLLLGLLARQGMAQEPRCYREEVRRLMTWLPDETESLLVIRGVERKTLIDSGVDRETRADIIRLLSHIRNGRFVEQLPGAGVVLWAIAAGRFQEPIQDRVWANYAGADVVVYERDVGGVTAELLGKMASDADAVLDVRGRRVLYFKETWSKTQWNYYVATPTPNTFVVATDEQYLREMIARIDKPQAKSFIHNDRIESELSLHDNTYVWALRRYKKPLDSFLPKGSVGFFFRIAEPKVATITFLTEGETAASSVRDFWEVYPPISIAPTVTQVRRGEFNVQHSLQDGELRGAFWLLLMIRLIS